MIDQLLKLQHPYQHKHRNYVLINGQQQVCPWKQCTWTMPVRMCFDRHSVNWNGWLPGKLTADNVCVRKVMCVLGVEGGVGHLRRGIWKPDSKCVSAEELWVSSFCVNDPLPCTFCSWIWALTTRYSADGGFWLATSSSVSLNQLNKGSRASWNFPQCNKASCSWAMRSATWRRRRHY